MADGEPATTSLATFLSIASISGSPYSPHFLRNPSHSPPALRSFTTPAITVPFPSGYGQTQIPFALAYSSVFQPTDPETIGGVRPTGSSVSTSTPAQKGGGGWPSWATPVIASVGGFVVLCFLAGVWLCCRRRNEKKDKTVYGLFSGQGAEKDTVLAENLEKRRSRRGSGRAVKSHSMRMREQMNRPAIVAAPLTRGSGSGSGSGSWDGREKKTRVKSVVLPSEVYFESKSPTSPGTPRSPRNGDRRRSQRESRGDYNASNGGGRGRRDKEKDDWGYIDFRS
ncbi:hypothetical protein BT69DRAFT_1349732 [Atractiella rhizophila]|nr:hypothetical protein BT69DRAFT_1349732 [Atractiella rhizophila]